MTEHQKTLPLFEGGTSQDVPPDSELPATVTQGPGDEGPLKRLMDENFLRYASYVIRDRAIPDVDDGLKPVQRRILYSLYESDDGKFVKVANAIGRCMQFHPHGDAAIGDALVSLANRQYLIERQGNFGNPLTGDPPAAARYIECRLSDLARNELFNDDLTEFVPSYDGRKQEPVSLPSKLPLLLMLGAEGIAVGVSTRILPHNFIELLEAQISILEKRPYEVFPDFPQGGLVDARGYDQGRGHVLVRAQIEKTDEHKIVIRQIPFGTTTDSLMASVEEAARKGKIKIKSINDFTAEHAEIEIQVPAEQNLDRAVEALYAFTQCQMQIASRITVIRENKPVEMDVPQILRYNTHRLVDILRRELQRKRRRINDEMHALVLVRLFVEHRIYKKIEESESPASMLQAVLDGLRPFRDRLERDVTHEDVEMLLGIPIRRISLYDLEKNRKDVERLRGALSEVDADLAAVIPYAIRYLRSLVRKYGSDYPRRAQLAIFGEISERELTSSELSVFYDEQKGYLGHRINGTLLLSCSSLDRLILIWKDGRCKTTPPPEKIFVDTSLIHCSVFNRESLITLAYECDLFTHIKKFTIGGLVTNREYRLIPKNSRVLLLDENSPQTLYVRYAPDSRSKIRQQEFSLRRLSLRDRDSKGLVMTAKRIESIGSVKPSDWDDDLTGPPGKLTGE